MSWQERFDFVLFDLDGLLVDTEQLHFQAYQQVCRLYGYELPWDFSTYSGVAHTSSEGVRLKIGRDLPGIYQIQPNWNLFYEEKKKAFLELLAKGKLSLLPGVEKMLQTLTLESCIVTHSPLLLVETIMEQLPILRTIPHKITREDYVEPKPSPEPYQTALKRFQLKASRTIGFEDTFRGWQSLDQSGIVSCVVSSVLSQEHLQFFRENNVWWIPSFDYL